MLFDFLIFRIIAASLLVNSAQPDLAFVRVEIKMAEDGFMCPFLKPMFLGVLEDKGVEWVVCRPKSSEVEFCTALTKSESMEVYSSWLTQLGYADAQIQYTAFDTLAFLPSPPLPPGP